MKPINFPQSNILFQKPSSMTDEECGSLPVYNDGSQSISCWELSWKERLEALVFGRVWLFVIYGTVQPPVSLMTGKTVFLSPQKETDDKL